MLCKFNPLPTFSLTAEITCFILYDYTGKGLGKALLGFLEKEGRKRGLVTILADISALNTGSIKFYKDNGFIKCGRFEKVGKIMAGCSIRYGCRKCSDNHTNAL